MQQQVRGVQPRVGLLPAAPLLSHRCRADGDASLPACLPALNVPSPSMPLLLPIQGDANSPRSPVAQPAAQSAADQGAPRAAPPRSESEEPQSPVVKEWGTKWSFSCA